MGAQSPLSANSTSAKATPRERLACYERAHASARASARAYRGRKYAHCTLAHRRKDAKKKTVASKSYRRLAGRRARAARAPVPSRPPARRLVALGLARRLGAPPARHVPYIHDQARGPGRGACRRRPMGMEGSEQQLHTPRPTLAGVAFPPAGAPVRRNVRGLSLYLSLARANAIYLFTPHARARCILAGY